MGSINCTFQCVNESGQPLKVSYDDIDHGENPYIKINPIPIYDPNYGECTFATATSDGAGCHGNIMLTSTAGQWEFTYDNPDIGAASTPKYSAPTGYGIAVSLKDDVWTITCTKLSTEKGQPTRRMSAEEY